MTSALWRPFGRKIKHPGKSGKLLVHGIKHNINDIKFKSKQLPWIPIALITGVILRILGSTSSALWFDEVLSISITRRPLLEMIFVDQININPPGWEILQWFVTRLLGRNEISSRFFAILAGIISLWVANRLMQELRFSYRQRAIGMVALAVLPYLLWMSQDGKVYALFSLLYILGLLWVLQGHWLGFTAILGLLPWCHNTGLIYDASLCLLALICHFKSWRKVLFSGVIAGICWLPWASIFFAQTGNGVPWIKPLDIQEFFSAFSIIVFGFTLKNVFLAFLVVVLSVLTITWLICSPLTRWIKFQMRQDIKGHRIWKKIFSWFCDLFNQTDSIKPDFFLFCAFVLPLFFFVLIAIIIQNVFFYRTASSLLIPLALWTIYKLTPERINWIHKSFLVAWASVILFCLAFWSPAGKGGNLFEVIQWFKEEWQQGDILYHMNGISGLVFWYYLPNFPQYMSEGEYLFSKDIEISMANVPRTPLEKTHFQRAWVIWDTSSLHINKYNNDVYLHMSEILQRCMKLNAIYYPHQPRWEIYLCKPEDLIAPVQRIMY